MWSLAARKSNRLDFRKVVEEQRNIIKEHQLQHELIQRNCIESGNFVRIMLGQKLQDHLKDIIQANYQREYALVFTHVKNQSETIKIIQDSNQNRNWIVVSMPYLIHASTEAEVVERILRTGLSSPGGPGVSWHTQIMVDQPYRSTLFQPGGTDYTIYINIVNIVNQKLSTKNILVIPVNKGCPIFIWTTLSGFLEVTGQLRIKKTQFQ